MANENLDTEDIEDIDVTDIDWNTLSKDNFQQLEHSMQLKITQARKEKAKNQERTYGNIVVKLRGKSYNIKKVLLLRLKAMKNEKSKNKLIDQIIEKYNPIEEL